MDGPQTAESRGALKRRQTNAISRNLRRTLACMQRLYPPKLSLGVSLTVVKYRRTPNGRMRFSVTLIK